MPLITIDLNSASSFDKETIELKELEHIGVDVPPPSAPLSMDETSTTDVRDEHVSGQQMGEKKKSNC